MVPPNTLTLPVAFSGAPGAWSEEAARRRYGAAPTLTCQTAEEALDAVLDQRAAHAVVPVENTVTGRFPGLVELLFDRPALHVVGEVEIAVRHCLMALRGTRLEDVSVVASHPTALAHCRDYLARLGVATRPASDSGRAAEELSIQRDPGTAVLGSRGLAERYGFAVLAEGLSDVGDNRTRFYAIGREPSAEEVDGAVRSALLVGPVDRPRALKTLRITLESLGARRTRSPLLGAGDGHRFLVELDHDPGAGARLALAAAEGVSARRVGSWRP